MYSLVRIIPLAGIASLLAVSEAAAMPPIKSGPGNAVPQCVTPGRLMAYLRHRNPMLERRYATIAAEYMRAGETAGIRWDVAFFQMIVETASLTYRRSNGQPATVQPDQNNFAGIGATGGNVPGETFHDIAEGVRAHVQHLQMYAGDLVEAPIAERTRKVHSWGILNPWRQGLARPVTFDDLALKWAPGDRAYGPSVDSVGRRFYEGFCHIADPEPPLVADARGDREAPYAPTTGIDLARQAVARSEAEGAARASLGAGSMPPPAASKSATAAQPPLQSVRILNTPRAVPAALPPPAQPRVAAPPPPSTDEVANEALRALVAGNTVLLDTPLGTTVPIAYAADGTMRGKAGALVAHHLGGTTDSGRWWVEKGQLCHHWKIWFDRQQQCLKLRQSGQTIHWTRASDGKTGTAKLGRN